MMTPVTIRGTTYKSQREAAEALGVSQTTIHFAMLRGTLDKVGLGGHKTRSKPVMVDGVRYPSISAAARSLGITGRAFHAICAYKRKRGLTNFLWRDKHIVFVGGHEKTSSPD